MYNFDKSYHRGVKYYVSEYLNIKMKNAQNLKDVYFRSKTHYIHIADHFHKTFLKLSK